MRKLVLVALASVVAAALAGCGCTTSYPVSLVTLGMGYQYCGKNIFGSRCLGPDGHQDSGCHCNDKAPCRTSGKKADAGGGCCAAR